MRLELQLCSPERPHTCALDRSRRVPGFASPQISQALLARKFSFQRRQQAWTVSGPHHDTCSPLASSACRGHGQPDARRSGFTNFMAATAVLLNVCLCNPTFAAARGSAPASDRSFTNIPDSLDSTVKVPEHLGQLLQGKSVEECARKCIGTCIRGGQGAPGLGPLSMRKEIIVFKQGFRSRTYCLSECTQVCALMAKMK